MLQLFFFYFFFPIVLHIELALFPTVIITFVFNYSAYFAEIYRGGINSIDRGQYEAAHALGVPKSLTMKEMCIRDRQCSVLKPLRKKDILQTNRG